MSETQISSIRPTPFPLPPYWLSAGRSSNGLNEFCFGVSYKFSPFVIASSVCTSSPSITPNKWYHIAGVFDNSANTQALYIDGKKIIGTVNDANLFNTSDPFVVGGPPYQEMNTLMAEFRKRNRFFITFSFQLEGGVPTPLCDTPHCLVDNTEFLTV